MEPNLPDLLVLEDVIVAHATTLPADSALPNLPELPDFEHACKGHGHRQPTVGCTQCSRKRKKQTRDPRALGKHVAVAAHRDLPSLPACSNPVEKNHEKPVVGGKLSKRKHRIVNRELRLASKSIPWRELPYLRKEALD